MRLAAVSRSDERRPRGLSPVFADDPADAMVRHALQSLDETLLRALLRELGEDAAERRFEVAPNPCVGAAVLAGDALVAKGVHEVWGGPHAERVALDAAARTDVPADSWDTLLVTLEPCSSNGKTGPCVDAILETGIRRVVVGSLDPDPRHRGHGLELLREAGVEVLLFEGVTPLEQVSPHFLAWTRHERLRRPRPWTIAKWAQTRTGQLSPPADVGEGQWISGIAARNEVQVLRGRVDAILTGVGTVLADDPRLSVRAPGDPTHPPLRIVLDSRLATPPAARLFAPATEDEAVGPVVVLTHAGMDAPRMRALEGAGAEVIGLHADEFGRIALRDVHEWLWDHGVRRMLLEAGPTLLQSHFEAEFIDQFRVYTGAVNGGRGPSLAETLVGVRTGGRLDREIGEDAVLEAFVD